MRSPWVFAPAILALLIVAAVLLHHGQSAYGITLWNKTSSRVETATLFYGSDPVNFDNTQADDGTSGYGYVTLPIPERAALDWTLANGERHHQAFEIRKWIRKPRSFEGKLYFVVNPDGTASFVPVRDSQEWTIDLDHAKDGHSAEPKAPI